MILHALIFGLLCVLIFFLPLLPALMEWRQKRDATPLKVVRDYDGNIQHFANGFRHFLAQHFTGLVPGSSAQGALPPMPLDRGSFQLVGDNDTPRFTAGELAARACTRLLIGGGALTLGNEMFYEKELYAGGRLQGGNRNSFRAILAHGDIALGDDCVILRWAHSDASLAIGARARLYGRVSAERDICLQAGSRFGRMSAKVIRFGAQPEACAPAPRTVQPLVVPDDVLDQSGQRWLVHGTLAVPANASHSGDLVARKNVSIGERATLHGNIKSNGDMVIGSGVHIEGALVATGNIQIGPDCLIKGPVVCDGQVVIRSGTVIGRTALPTTVTAAEIRVEQGVQAYGTVWARELGAVTALRT